MAYYHEDLRKHATQLQPAEKIFLQQKISGVSKDEWIFSDHAKDRMYERKILDVNVLACFSFFEIVEYHKKGNESRILIRSKTVFKGRNICIVVAPSKKKNVSVYTNDSRDSHRTIDFSQYSRNLNVLSTF